MINREIVNVPIVLFLGAGASAPLGKWLMSDFLVYLRSRLNNRLPDLLDAIARYKSHDLEAMMDELADLCDKPYLSDTTRVNYITDLLDPSRSEIRKLESVPSEFSKQYKLLVDQCQSLRFEIEKLIFEHYREVDTEKARELYDPVLKVIIDSTRSARSATEQALAPIVIPIFTTNYDLTIETFAETNPDITLINGFHRTKWKRSEFDEFQPNKTGIYIALFKLHGSVNWYRDIDGSIKEGGVALYQHSDPKIRNLIIYPAQNKIALEDPFLLAYEYFQRSLDQALNVVFIGYSFRDYDTVTKIKASLNYNSELRVAILDPASDSLIEKWFKGYEDRITPLCFRFGFEAASYLSPLGQFCQDFGRAGRELGLNT